jgi:hypothetical protein
MHQCPRFEQRIHALRTSINRSDMKRRPPRCGIHPVDDPACNSVLLILSARCISRQTIGEPFDVIRGRRKVDEPREQSTLRRGCLCCGPRPRCTRVGWLVLGAGHDDRGHRVTRGGSQPNNVRERPADRFEVRIDSGRARGARRSREFATQWCNDQSAHLLDGELGFGEEVAEFGEGTLLKTHALLRWESRGLFLGGGSWAYLGRHVATRNYTRL